MQTIALHSPRVQLEAHPGGTPAITYGFAETPYGTAFVAFLEDSLCFLGFGGEDEQATLLNELARNWPGARLTEAEAPLPCPWDEAEATLTVRGTELQLAVWQALLDIPAGETVSYEALAWRVGRPSAVRAVASAVGANPVSWLIPCHRVLRKDGSAGGYRWGLAVKSRLLQSELSNA